MRLSSMKKLSLFCFLCGKLRHGEGFCPIKLTLQLQEVNFGWDISLRATPRRGSIKVSRWLREENQEGISIRGETRKDKK